MDERGKVIIMNADMQSAELVESSRPVSIPAGSVSLEGELTVPPAPHGIVLFAHGSGSSRHSPRNRAVAQLLRKAGLGTLLFDLLTPREERADAERGNL